MNIAGRRLAKFLALSLGAVLTAVAAWGDAGAETATWPQWRGALSSGTVAAEAFPAAFHLEVRWRTELGSGYSGVVVADRRAVTMFSDGRHDWVGALDADDGAEVWRVRLAPTFPGREGAVDGPCSTPAIDAGTVFALGPTGDLVAIELATGELSWRVDIAQTLGAEIPHWGLTTSPLVVDGRVVVMTGGADGRIVTAFDAASGREVWSAGRDGGSVSYQSPVLATLAGRRQIVAASDTLLFGFDPATGKELWRHEHGGASFYSRIINPVIVDDERMLMTLRPEEAEMVRVTAGAGGFDVTTDWTSPHLKRNYATPIHHEGYLYGLGGQLLTCVDARDGSLKWQSRVGGDSWPIVVGAKLVTLTKSGTLHVLDAAPEGSVERASLQMFDRLVWTPPSFAYGRVYGRESFTQVAAVAIVHGARRVDRAAAADASDSAFLKWIAGLEGAADREARIRRFLDETKFPLVEGDRTVHLIYHGRADDLAVQGDMLKVREQRPMRRVPGIDGNELFHATFELEPDARVNYQFVRNLTETLTDPLNDRKSNSLFYNGEASQLLMPQAESPSFERVVDPDERNEPIELEHAEVKVGRMTWGGKRNVGVYLPPGYHDSGERYPTVYVLYGMRMLEFGNLDAGFDELVGTSIRPVIVVSVGVMSAYEYARSQRGVHGRMLVEELVPQIDATYRTLTSPEHRVIAGGDEAGYSAIELALRYPHVFGNASAQSIRPIGAGDRQLMDTVGLLPALPVRIAVDWGKYDARDPRNGTNVPEFCRRLLDAMTENDYDVTGREWSDGPDLQVWAARLLDVLAGWFPPAGAAGQPAAAEPDR